MTIAVRDDIYIKKLILTGWPDNKNEVPDAAKPYFDI